MRFHSAILLVLLLTSIFSCRKNEKSQPEEVSGFYVEVKGETDSFRHTIFEKHGTYASDSGLIWYTVVWFSSEGQKIGDLAIYIPDTLQFNTLKDDTLWAWVEIQDSVRSIFGSGWLHVESMTPIDSIKAHHFNRNDTTIVDGVRLKARGGFSLDDRTVPGFNWMPYEMEIAAPFPHYWDLPR